MTEIKAVENRFAMGRVMATPALLEALGESGQTPGEFLARHQRHEQGELSDDDHWANTNALSDGGRILSAFLLSTAVKIWIITEAINDDGKRWSTTMLLPSEY